MVDRTSGAQLITALDHVVIGVRDLQEATRRHAAEGFSVAAGGRHTGRGTHNSLISLRNSYLELISVYDEAEASAAGRRELTKYLRRSPGGPVAYALQTDALDTVAARLSDQGTDVVGPFTMQRAGADGRTVEWRLVVPHGNQYCTWWPFFIQWNDPAADWPTADHPHHSNGSREVVEVVVATDEPGADRAMFESVLGLDSTETHVSPHWNATAIAYDVAGTRLVIASPTGPGKLEQILASDGAGVLRIDLDAGSAIGPHLG